MDVSHEDNGPLHVGKLGSMARIHAQDSMTAQPTSAWRTLNDGRWFCFALSLLVLFTACSRRKYRFQADSQVDEILREKDACEPYDLPENLTVYPDVRSRFFDSSLSDCPQVPNPQPLLDAYTLPPLVSGDPARQAEWQQSEGDSISAPSEMGVRIVPIPTETWDGIPPNCLPRMLEFASVREEYDRSFNVAIPEELSSDAPRLSLPNIMELAQINSREYQSRKEVLYQVALRLTRERFEYQLRPTATGNGSSLNYRSLNVDGTNVNTLNIPTGAAATQTLNTAGQFLASFANNVVLTFNGPQGFAADVGSEILFDFQQTIFQRDIVFERLTQAERDVVYASRDYIRFRRQLFRDLSDQYYNLLLTYRAIEIASLDYFSNLRGFLQGRAEYEFTGGLPRVQVDQFEQNALRSRSDLVSRCNQLESSLDRLKLAVGLPPEMSINLALDELESLTASDEWTVARELVSRTRRDLVNQQERGRIDSAGLINAANVLVDRIKDIQRLTARIEESGQTAANSSSEMSRLAEIAVRLRTLEARSRVDFLSAEIRNSEDENSRLLESQKYLRVVELTEAQLDYARRLLDLRDFAPETATFVPSEWTAKIEMIQTEITSNDEYFRSLEPLAALAELPKMVQGIEALQERASKITQQLAADTIPESEQGFRQLVQDSVDAALQLADEAITGADQGLSPIELDESEAMLTALGTRLDLMNRRGDLADARRAIKLAGDELRSVLDLRASHILRTPGNANKPFDFNLDNSETRLSIALDTPLNRRAQRNNYRVALINYNQAIRDLINAEDNIKFEIRDDLRRLQLRRDQYEIGVKSAALAYERVVSTRLQLQLATGDVVARDFLEAQQAYTAALSSVAGQHIAFILDRVELFFDLEAIRVDQLGFWAGLKDEDLPPPVDLNFPANNPAPYGRLPAQLRYSPEVRASVSGAKP